VRRPISKADSSFALESFKRHPRSEIVARNSDDGTTFFGPPLTLGSKVTGWLICRSSIGLAYDSVQPDKEVMGDQ